MAADQDDVVKAARVLIARDRQLHSKGGPLDLEIGNLIASLTRYDNAKLQERSDRYRDYVRDAFDPVHLPGATEHTVDPESSVKYDIRDGVLGAWVGVQIFIDGTYCNDA